MIAIIDYGIGNLFSLKNSLEYLNQEVLITNDISTIENADKIILPGVGAFGDGMNKLRELNLVQVIINQAKSGKPLLGICLGMQLLFDESYEYGIHQGLGIIKGKVIPMEGKIDTSLKVPQIGWNQLHFTSNRSPIFKDLNENDCAYFVHSYFATDCDSSVVATTNYSIEITAAVQKNNIYGCQFHPEKSGKVGLKILKAFCEL